MGSNLEGRTMKLPTATLATPAEIATELGLTGLFVMGTDGDSSRYNHADGTSGTIVGTPTYTSNLTTFPVNSYIDTGIAETTNLTLAGATAKTGLHRGIVYNINGENDLLCALYCNNFGIRSQFEVSGNKVGATNDRASIILTPNESAKAANNCIILIGAYPINGNAYLWEPRNENKTGTASVSGGGRVVVGSNYRIGWIQGSASASQVHIAAIADTAFDDEKQADLFVWMSKFLIRRGVYP
jgi:hypothetical protein